jgi:bla regulator protein BlaR1
MEKEKQSGKREAEMGKKEKKSGRKTGEVEVGLGKKEEE